MSGPNSVRVSVPRKLAYGAGGLADFLAINLPLAMAVPIFSVALGMDPALLGTAMAIAKVAGAAAAPIVGNWSDNARSTLGRRAPFMLAGAAVGCVCLPLLFLPMHVGDWTRFAWVSALLSVVSVAHTIYSVPYNALGLELTSDYDDRARVLAWRGYVQTLGTFAAAWFYWFTLRPIFGGEQYGAAWLAGLVSVVALGCAFVTVKYARERVQVSAEPEPMPLLPALRETLRQRQFLLVQMAAFLVALGTGATGVIGFYLHVHYACGGDKDLASVISGAGGTLTMFSAFVGLPLGLLISKHFGRRAGALVGLAFVMASIVILPWAMTPEDPQWVIASWLLSALGMQCAGLMFASMIADICDEDELRTGRRREGAYCAVANLFGRIAQVAMLVVGGWLPALAGFRTHPARVLVPSADQLLVMKWTLIGTQGLGVALAMGCLAFYSLSRSRAERTRVLLDSRRRQLDADRADASGPSEAGKPAIAV
jgi:glycoside/pentoside/hexuronide:cation symporter, GPH family